MSATSDRPGADRTLACVVHGAGDLRVERVPLAAPGPGEALVRVALGGICGSDLHYDRDGGVGDYRVRAPMVLGHEVVGTLVDLGDGVVPGDLPGAPAVGAAVAVHPATVCGTCLECLAGRPNVCRLTRYLGSAARVPHVQGGFAQHLVVPARQVHAVPAGLELSRAVLAEPLSVALHAVARAGDVAGAIVLVTGAGPIGLLVAAALRAAGAGRVVVSDVVDEALRLALAVGADQVVRADRPDDEGWPEEVDVAVEASGAPAALATCLQLVRRAGRVVQLGLLPPGAVAVPANLVVTKEVDLVGAFRFGAEFPRALQLLAEGLPVGPVVTATLPLRAARDAFDLAGDRRRASKVLLDLTGD